MTLHERAMNPGASLFDMRGLSGRGFAASTACSRSRARTGRLTLGGLSLQTPALFPVLDLLTGPPPLDRNGGIYKLLKELLIFRDRRSALIAEVLHFTDFHITPKLLKNWFPHLDGTALPVTLPAWVERSFVHRGEDSGGFRPLLYLDSGGFRLLFNRQVDLAPYGYAATQESILDLQLTMGADIVASLDYPIPPNLNRSQADERMVKGVDNAVALMRLIYRDGKRTPDRRQPFPILAVHGQTPEQMEEYVCRLFGKLRREGYGPSHGFGIGIGSLVPLRVSSAADKIVGIVKAAVDAMRKPEIVEGFDPESIPVHAFGITGDMIPALVYLGVDTFDSSTYVRSASCLQYYDPTTWSARPFLDLAKVKCECPVCRDMDSADLGTMQRILRGPGVTGKAPRMNETVGNYRIPIKSDAYALIAYHNLSLQDREIEGARAAIERDEMPEHLVGFSKVHARAQALAEFIAETDRAVAAAMGHVALTLRRSSHPRLEGLEDEVSLENDPGKFDVSQTGYSVPERKDRLLILACSKAKPYRKSRTHRGVARFLDVRARGDAEQIHTVTLSGLYGPVPRDLEDLGPILSYDYVLSTSAREQIDLVSTRLAKYLVDHCTSYSRVVAYVATTPYRIAVERAFEAAREEIAGRAAGAAPAMPEFRMLPDRSKGIGARDLLVRAHLSELAAELLPDCEPRFEDTQKLMDV